MIKLNLKDKTKSDIAYKKISYPDGQNDIRILNCFENDKDELIEEKSNWIRNAGDIQIISRFNNFIDFEFIIAATQCLKEIGCENIHLRIPYMFSARCDRKFVNGGNFYLKSITSLIINSQDYSSVTTCDVHNFKKTNELIKNFYNESILPLLVKEALFLVNEDYSSKCYIISPDKGAKFRTESVCKEIRGWDYEIVQCDKERDLLTSKIEKLIIPKDNFDGSDCIILDDLIDGGRTFTTISQELKKRNCGRIFLVASHGIFSAGFDKLKESGIEKIFVTNSYSDIQNTNGFIHQIDVF